MAKRRSAQSSSKNNTTQDNMNKVMGVEGQGIEGAEGLELTEEEMLRQERLERQHARQLRRDEIRSEILAALNISKTESSNEGNVAFETPDCPWRHNLSSPLERFVNREEESHEAKLKRNKIPPKKMNDMIARWMLSLVSVHTHHKNTNESLASIVYKERLKASKGLKSTADNYIMSMLDAVTRLSHMPRVSLFAKVAGLYPQEGFIFFPESAKILVYLIKQCFGMQTASAERLEEDGNVWLSAEVADSCVQNMFEQNPYWNLEKWHESCYKYNVNLPWSDHVKRSELAADLARIITTVDDIDAKDRRRLPSDIRGAGVTQVIIDADRLMDLMFSAFIKERSRVETELEEAEIHRMKVQRRMQQAYQQQLISVQVRPMTNMERHYLKKGVKRFGVGAWKRILEDKRYVLVHRTEEVLEQEWAKIAARRAKREKRRWDWRRWPWNPEWEWGGLIVGKEGDNCGGESPNVDIWALIEEQGYYESEEDEDEDGFDSDSTHYADSSEGEEYYEDDESEEPQVIPHGNGVLRQQPQLAMQPISENSDPEGEGDGFFLTTSATGGKKSKAGGMMPSASAPELGAKTTKKSPYVVDV